MSSQSGKYGQVQVGASIYAEINKWTMTITTDAEQHGVFAGDGWKIGTAGLAAATGTVEGKYDFADPLAGLLTIGDLVVLKLFLTTDAGPIGSEAFYTVNAHVTGLNFDVDGDTGAAVSFTFDWQSTGPIVNP